MLISILICNKYFHMTQIFVQEMPKHCVIQNLKPWLHISGLGSLILDTFPLVLDLESQLLGPGFLVLVS